MSYQPSEELLEKYADVMINFALNGGEGVKNGEVVQLRVSEVAKPLLVALRRAVLKAGAHPIIFYTPDEFCHCRFHRAPFYRFPRARRPCGLSHRQDL